MRLRPRWFAAVLAIALTSALGNAQQAPTLVGKWEGTLKSRDATGASHEARNRPSGTRTVVTIAAAPDGAYTVTQIAVDVNKQIQLTDVVVDGDTIRWKAPVFNATYEGKLSEDGEWIKGKWTQFRSTASVNFKRVDDRQ
jgi:hypothetical protein